MTAWNCLPCHGGGELNVLGHERHLSAAAERSCEPGDYDLSGIRTVAELIGYLATVAREKGWDEVEVVAVFIKVATPCREHVREAEQLLRQLGYTAVCDHLRKIAGHLPPKPPRRWVRS